MEWSLFWPGLVGALVTVYIVKNEIIPEFRSLLDTSEAITERDELKEKNKRTEKEIDEAQAKVSQRPDSPESRNLRNFIDTSQRELEGRTKRLQRLEDEIRLDQIWRKGIGLVVYIFLGGFFGAFLPDFVKIESDLPKVVVSFIIGAGWTGYLSAIGFKPASRNAEESIQNLENEVNQTLRQLQNAAAELKKKSGELIADQPDQAEELKGEIDAAAKELQISFMATRQKVKRDFKGIL